MRDEKGKKKDVYVTIILTESATSLLNLNLPHLEKLHPSNSKICLISPSEYNSYGKTIKTKCKQTPGNKRRAGTSRKDKDEPIFLKISSDVGLFSTSNCSSSSSLSGKIFIKICIYFLHIYL